MTAASRLSSLAVVTLHLSGALVLAGCAPWASQMNSMHDDEVLKALDHGADPNAREGNAFTALQAAIVFGRDKVALALIAHGANIGPSTDPDQATPLHHAAAYCRLVVVTALVAKGADLKAETMYRATPIDSAIHDSRQNPAECVAVVKALADAGAAFGPRQLWEDG